MLIPSRYARLWFCWLLAGSLALIWAPRLQGQPSSKSPSVAEVFAAVPFDQWAREPAATPIPWKVHLHSYGLSVHQRLVAGIALVIEGRELVKRVQDGRLLALVRVTDGHGREYHDFGAIDIREVKPENRKNVWVSTWDAFALPGDYRVELALYDKASREHNFMKSRLHVAGLKKDPLPDAWKGLPDWEFWAPITEQRDAIYRPDIETDLHLAVRTHREIQVELLADLTPSDLFHGSNRFYTHYLSVALPLLKELSEMELAHGSLTVAALDLRQRRVTFEQDHVTRLDWERLRPVVSVENGPGTINVKKLQQKQENPDFLRDELLRRLGHGDGPAAPIKVFIVLGSPMDFYAFHPLPPIEPAQAEKCVVYYLQYELYGPYATGALGRVRKMLDPIPIHAIKVRSPESIRKALARIVEEVGEL